jgi:fatty acid desaturase
VTGQVSRVVEWPTLLMIVACYSVWGVGIFILPGVGAAWLALAIVTTGVAIAFHSSLQHEIIHGHPFRAPFVNMALVFPALSPAVPFLRFRDTHLAHHKDAVLTDPYDDPESNYLDPGTWERLPRVLQALLMVNNTLAGRILLGPLVGQVAWTACEWRRLRSGDAAVLRGWRWHLPAVALVLGIVAVAPMPFWAYLMAAYLALGLLKIRTFLEHRADETARGRTVIIEDRGPLALLFLNNNLHVVHHMHPRVPWYRLWSVYRNNPGRYLGINGGYRYRSYAEVFRRYFLQAKDPVAHPLWRR